MCEVRQTNTGKQTAVCEKKGAVICTVQHQKFSFRANHLLFVIVCTLLSVTWDGQQQTCTSPVIHTEQYRHLARIWHHAGNCHIRRENRDLDQTRCSHFRRHSQFILFYSTSYFFHLCSLYTYCNFISDFFKILFFCI